MAPGRYHLGVNLSSFWAARGQEGTSGIMVLAEAARPPTGPDSPPQALPVAYPVEGRADAWTGDVVADVADRRASDWMPGLSA